MSTHYEDTRKFLQKIDSRLDDATNNFDDAERKAITRLLFEAIGMSATLERAYALHTCLYDALDYLDRKKEHSHILDFVRKALEILPEETD